VAYFKYLKCDISYEYNNDIDEKLCKLLSVCGTINITLKGKITKGMKLKFY